MIYMEVVYMGIAELVITKVPVQEEIIAISDCDKKSSRTLKSGLIVYSIVDSKDQIIRLAHHWFSYLTKCIGLSISKSTVGVYANYILYFVRWLEQSKCYSNLSVDDALLIVARSDIREWVKQMNEDGLAASTIHGREVALKQFLDWLCTNEGGRVRNTDESPYGRLDTPLKYLSKSGHKKSPKFINTEQVISLIRQFHNECERCLYHTQYDTGMRIGELIQLTQRDLPDLQNYSSDILFIPMIVSGLKGRADNKKERVTLISRAVLSRIARYHNTEGYKMSLFWDMNDPDKPVFLTANHLKWKYPNARKQFRNAANRAKLTKYVTHWLRHGTAFSVLRSDIGRGYEDKILTVQQMLGHSNLATTEIYTQLSPLLLQDLTRKGNELDRSSEAEEIRKRTYLPALRHKEVRGHR